MARTVAVAMVKDEADVIGPVVEHLATQVDHIIVADNLSTDGTRDILDDLAGRLPLTVVDDPVLAHVQSEKVTALARRARLEHGADWIVPFDGDEAWYCTDGQRIADVLAAIGEPVEMIYGTVFDHRPTGLDDPGDPNPLTRMGWRWRRQLPLPKVAARWRSELRIHRGNHGVDYDRDPIALARPLIVVRHFPYRSEDQFVRKATVGVESLRAAGDRVPENQATHKRMWGRMLDSGGEQALRDHYRRWFFWPDPSIQRTVNGETQGPLIFDPAPVRAGSPARRS